MIHNVLRNKGCICALIRSKLDTCEVLCDRTLKVDIYMWCWDLGGRTLARSKS